MPTELSSKSQRDVLPVPTRVMGVTATMKFQNENVSTLMESYQPMHALEQSTTPEVERADANLLNLLIVDDERAIRDGCREVAQQIGFQTYIADNAEHAFRVLDNTSVDVVLLDLRMPGLGGLEVLHEVKRRRPETVVIVITGYATVQSAVQAMKHGAYDYVTKPFNMEELRLLLERVTSHLQLTSENRILREQV